MNRIINIIILLIIILFLFTGCISDKGGNNKKVELSITNKTNESLIIQINISKDNIEVYNQTKIINSTEKIIVNEFDKGFGLYHIYLFVDKFRMIDDSFIFEKSSYPVNFEIKEDKIDWSQKKV